MEVVLHKDPDDEYDDGKLVFDVIASKRASFPKIGYTKDSETTIPNKLANLEENLWYWDCPGFDDTKGEEQDIPNAFYIKKIFDTASKFKLVLVIDYGDLVNDNSTKIKKLTDTLGNLFKGNELTTIVEGLSMVVTKADETITERNVKSQIVQLLKARAFTTDSAGKTILQFLKASENKIAIFKKPKEAGSLIDEDNAKVLGNNDAILKIIEGTKFVNNPVKINIAVSDASKLLIADLAQKVIDDSKECIKALSDTLDQSYKIKCDKLKGAKKLAKLKSLQDKLVAGLTKIIHSSIDNLQEEVQDFIGTLMLKFPGDKFLAKELFDNLRYLKFFKQIKADINLDITPWMEGFTAVRDTMLKYTYMPEEQIVQIRGKTVTSDDIKAAINDGCFKELKAVEVYAAKELVLSSDLNHENLKGINFSTLAPCWKVTTQVTIDLSGINGPSHAQQKADNGDEVVGANPDGSGKNGNKGIDGLPGLPGGNGGNFFGAGQEFTNIEYLTINVSGGIGGRGQDGGDGSNGTDATKHGSKELVQERARTVLKSLTSLSTDTIQFLETYESIGENGGRGGDGGMAGKGGRGGFLGVIKLYCKENDQPFMKALSGKEGNNGQVGNSGGGGYSGKIYHGQYAYEKVISNIINLSATAISTAAIDITTERKSSLVLPAVIVATPLGPGLMAFASSVLGSGIGLEAVGLGLGLVLGVFTLTTPITNFEREEFTVAERVIGAVERTVKALKGIGIAATLAVPKAVYDSYIKSGWQGEVETRQDKTEDGKVPIILNCKGMRDPKPANWESLINYSNLLKQYKEYLNLIGINNESFIDQVSKEVPSIEADNHKLFKQEDRLISDQDKPEDVMVEYTIQPTPESQPMDIAGAVLDPTLNAFNQKSNSRYFYQAADIKMIQSQLQKEFGDKLFIAEPSGSNQPIDVLLESFMQSLVFDRPMLCAVNHDNWHWVVTGITRQDTNIVMFNKDSMPNKKTQQGKIGINLPENLTLLINNKSEQTEGVDCGIFVLENMRIMAKELIANPQTFIEAFSTYSNFCTLNTAQQLRSGEFAKAYVKGVCSEMVNEKQKHSILTKIRENHQKELFSIRETLEKLNIDGSHIIILGANDILDKKSQLLITNESKKDISQTIGLEVAILAFNQQHKIYSYCYKMTWTIDLDWEGNIKFPKIEELFKDTSLAPIEDFHNKLITITPENCFGKYNFDLPLPKISFTEVCTALCINHNQELQNEAAVIFEEFMQDLTKEQVIISGGIVDSNVL